MRTSEQTSKKTLPIICTALTCALMLTLVVFLITDISGMPIGTSAGTEGQSSAGWLDKIAMKNAPPPESVAVEYLTGLDRGPGGEPFVVSTDGTRLYIDCEPDTPEGQLVFSYLKGNWSFKIEEAAVNGLEALVPVYFSCIDTALFEQPLRERTTALLGEKVEEAQRSEDIYDTQQHFRTEVLNDVFWAALAEVCAESKTGCSVEIAATLRLSFYEKAWHVENKAAITNTLDMRTQLLQIAATENQPYISKVYTIEETATAAPMPTASGFGETENAEEVSALLEHVYAKNLIRGQELCWSEDIERLPGTKIRYYLDESILMIEWQEEEAGMVGTFSEVFIADGSQIRRKLAGDRFESGHFYVATRLAQETNAVLAIGGDLYHHGRNCGIVVYNRTVYRFDPSTCDTCYIDTKGDMLFSYRGQFNTIEEAQRFVDENDILYSLCFGPVMIDQGVDVTPDNYLWGEIWDTYARAAIGMLGERHYLTMNLNCGTGRYYNYATLRQAADAMVARGCFKAYTLDGGQTCCTIVNGELISPVQFGYERETSDIIYFATSVPEY